jgi:hypothetical protein
LQLSPITSNLQHKDLDLHFTLKHIEYLKNESGIYWESAVQEFSAISDSAESDINEREVELIYPCSTVW